jgi:sigma-E factor negative regulatory protein RseA
MTTKNFTHEQISAFADDEAADDQFDLIMAALKTQEGRDRWAEYHEIGDVLRSDDMAVTMSPDFTARLMSRLDDEPTVIVPATVMRGRADATETGAMPVIAGIGKKRFALGGMAAAAVAALAFVTVPQIMVATKAGVGNNNEVAVASASTEQKAIAGSVTDVTGGNGEILRSADVDEYLLAHQRFSPSVYSTAQYARSATFAVDSEK